MGDKLRGGEGMGEGEKGEEKMGDKLIEIMSLTLIGRKYKKESIRKNPLYELRKLREGEGEGV